MPLPQSGTTNRLVTKTQAGGDGDTVSLELYPVVGNAQLQIGYRITTPDPAVCDMTFDDVFDIVVDGPATPFEDFTAGEVPTNLGSCIKFAVQLGGAARIDLTCTGSDFEVEWFVLVIPFQALGQ